MDDSIDYNQTNYADKQDAKTEKLRSHYKLRDRNVTVRNLILIVMMAILPKQTHDHLC